MILGLDFIFNQGKLQDYVDCRLRFYLRHVQRLAWPALQSQPALENEQHMQRGALFHRMAQQYLLGIPAERLADMLEDAQLAAWWANFSHDSALAEVRRDCQLYPEITLSASLAGYRLTAKYDLLAMGEEGRATIYDWKTSPRRLRSAWLAGRLQTRVYPYLLVRAGVHLNQDRTVSPERVRMIYWFAAHPQQAEMIDYDGLQYGSDERYLTGLIEEILALKEDDFNRTEDTSMCRFCTYRSLCGRGVQAGSIEEFLAEGDTEVGLDFDIDFEQIGELDYH